MDFKRCPPWFTLLFGVLEDNRKTNPWKEDVTQIMEKCPCG
jgi:hypothetical protein